VVLAPGVHADRHSTLEAFVIIAVGTRSRSVARARCARKPKPTADWSCAARRRGVCISCALHIALRAVTAGPLRIRAACYLLPLPFPLKTGAWRRVPRACGVRAAQGVAMLASVVGPLYSVLCACCSRVAHERRARARARRMAWCTRLSTRPDLASFSPDRVHSVCHRCRCRFWKRAQ
jgi:hypothetical protein